MEVEGPPKPRRLLSGHKHVNDDARSANHHTNPAFAGDEPVFVEAFARQSLEALANSDPSPDRKRSNSGSPSSLTKTITATRKGYNKLDEATESKNATRNDPSYSAKQETITPNTLGQGTKDNFSKPLSYEESSQTHQIPRSKPNSTVDQVSHDSLLDPRVGFKTGQKHSPRKENVDVKRAENISFQRTSLEKGAQPLRNNTKNQNHPRLHSSKQFFHETKDKRVFFAQDDVFEKGVDATHYFNPGFPQHHGTANKSTVPPLFRSLSVAKGKQQIAQQNFAARSQSMRLPRQRQAYNYEQPAEPKKLLRQLSFSDSNAKNIRDYGSLEGGQALPRRTLKSDSEENDTAISGNVSFSEESKLSPEATESVTSLMDELLDRGKIREIALLSQAGGAPIASLPISWLLPTNIATGVVKAVLETTQPLIRIRIDEEVYVCLKHGPDRMVGHSNNDDVLVAQKTAHFIVLGLSKEDTPGSCLQEVLELVEILTEKGW